MIHFVSDQSKQAHGDSLPIGDFDALFFVLALAKLCWYNKVVKEMYLTLLGWS
jgi:hypothetical protein